MFFPPLPLSRSLWKLSTTKWKVSRKKSSIKKPPSRLKPVEAAGGGEGDGDERAVVLGRRLPVDMSSSPLQMEQPQPQPHPQQMVRMDASLFDCASCSQILKPPTFKCDAGHVVCEGCSASHVEVCTDAVSSVRMPCPEMDRMVRGAMVSCTHKHRGCTAPVPYYELADHLRSCRFAPSCSVDSAETAAAASASGSPTPAPATRPKRDRRPNPRYAGPSWIT